MFRRGAEEPKSEGSRQVNAVKATSYIFEFSSYNFSYNRAENGRILKFYIKRRYTGNYVFFMDILTGQTK
jgi:hypothetical protein